MCTSHKDAEQTSSFSHSNLGGTFDCSQIKCLIVIEKSLCVIFSLVREKSKRGILASMINILATIQENFAEHSLDGLINRRVNLSMTFDVRCRKSGDTCEFCLSSRNYKDKIRRARAKQLTLRLIKLTNECTFAYLIVPI